jgi:hypothetical protein
VQARAHLEPRALDGVADPPRAADRPRRPVEGGEDAVAGAVDEHAAVRCQLPVDGADELVEQPLPAAVAELADALGRADDVDEEHRSSAACGTSSGIPWG